MERGEREDERETPPFSDSEEGETDDCTILCTVSAAE